MERENLHTQKKSLYLTSPIDEKRESSNPIKPYVVS
jgi:hypothetical protein